MKNTNKMMIRKEILAGLLLLICISNISAFAVSSDYWSGNSLKVNPGETKQFSLILQNLVGTSDITIRAIVTGSSDILRLTDSSNIYLVPAGQKINVNLEVNMPIDASPGQIYGAKVDFSEVKDSSSGEFGFGTAIGQAFDIVALPLPEPVQPTNNSVMLYIIAGTTLLLAVIIFTLRKVMKRKSDRKGKK